MNNNIKKHVLVADENRKVNPLDLSLDQDLTIALMNLVAIEDACPDSKIGDMTRDIREQLMKRMVADKSIRENARDYLSGAIGKMNDAAKAQESGDKKKAYELYEASYEAYVLYLAMAYGIKC